MSLNILDSKEKRDIASLRETYTRDGIIEEELPSDPLPLFIRWVDEAIDSEADEPNAMSLATVSADGKPNVRVVLLKGIENNTLQFYTNYKSQKGKELEQVPQAAAAFWWPELERQVRIRGGVEKLSRNKAHSYFQSRPRESQIGAWVSEQSSPIENRDEMKEKFKKIIDRFDGENVPTPEYWGGYSIHIEEIEFWQGRPARLHDRVLYTRKNGKWKKQRLQP